MSELPTIFVVTVEGDHSDDDYTGVTKRITSTGAEYRIVGPLADALRRHDDNLDSAFQRAYGEALNIRAEVPFEFLNAPAGEVDMETYEAVRAMAQEIKRLRSALLKITTGDQYKAAWDNGYEAAQSERRKE